MSPMRVVCSDGSAPEAFLGVTKSINAFAAFFALAMITSHKGSHAGSVDPRHTRHHNAQLGQFQ